MHFLAIRFSFVFWFLQPCECRLALTQTKYRHKLHIHFRTANVQGNVSIQSLNPNKLKYQLLHSSFKHALTYKFNHTNPLKRNEKKRVQDM